ncbi:hypothetical protein FB451DRAFT_1289888, partial [Mycena latifolia]
AFPMHRRPPMWRVIRCSINLFSVTSAIGKGLGSIRTQANSSSEIVELLGRLPSMPEAVSEASTISSLILVPN